MDRELLDRLTEKINNGSATEQELGLFNAYMNSLATAEKDWSALTDGGTDSVKEQLWNRIEPSVNVATVKLFPWKRIAVAAAVLLCASVAVYFFIQPVVVTTEQTAQNAPDVAPGGNKAILTLSSGKQIVLSDALNGDLATEDNTRIEKSADGEVIYSGSSASGSSPVYNTITTPNGGQYTLTLSDGTMALLDAGSSLRYPVAFSKSERSVEMTGQVYFSVTHNAKQPFRVKVKGQVVEDLGTQFNINAYDNESVIRTTLVEGSAKIIKGGNSSLLKPGFQGVTSAASSAIELEQANVEEITAWKNGYFRFNDEKIESITRQLSRWYNVDFRFEGTPTEEEFNGKISRFKNISQVLKMLERTKGVHFKIEGKEVIVRQ